MTSEMMNTREVADYLGIHEKQVYALIKEKRIPCTRVTGKWIFPRHLIDGWIERNAMEGRAQTGAPRQDTFIMAAGSNDPILDVLLNRMKGSGSRLIFSCSTGSSEGLRLLAGEQVDIAWCHLFHRESGTYNIPQAASLFPGKKIAVVHLFFRDIGFVLARECEDRVRSFKDLAAQDIAFINRQKGSGTRLFIDYNLEKEKVDPASIRGYDREVFTHMEVALTIVAGEAQAGVASVAVSKLLGLPFRKLVRESFDMVLGQDVFFSPEIQRFIETLNSPVFRQEVVPLGSYDFGESGKILFSN